MEITREHTAAVTPPPGRYRIDPVSSVVRFRTRHMFGLAPVRGTFGVRAGIVDVTEPLTASRISADIEVASFHTRNPPRDASIRSARFLDVDQYPIISFGSTGLDGRRLTGTVTVCDVTRPVELLVELSDVSPRAFTARATVRIDRTEFGVTAQRGLAGRYLDLSVEARCVRS
jgi:polyisoprenoid-binding protein YceI